jgi:hypothetical protein
MTIARLFSRSLLSKVFNLVRNGLYPIKAKVSDYSGCCAGADSDMSASSIPSTTEVST